jgi:hypothetical protein
MEAGFGITANKGKCVYGKIRAGAIAYTFNAAMLHYLFDLRCGSCTFYAS